MAENTTDNQDVEYEDAYKYVPAIATTSLNEMLDAFCAVKDGGGLNGGYSCLIESISTNATKEIESSPDMRDDDIGLEAAGEVLTSYVNFDYQLEFDEDGYPINELDNQKVKEIHRAENVAGVRDAAVDEITILVSDEEMGEMVGNGREKWTIKFRSDPIHGDDDRNMIDRHPINQQLIEDEGFQHRVLNCHHVINRTRQLMGDGEPLFEWDGSTFASLKNNASVQVIRRLGDRHGGGYGYWKQYASSKDDSIELVESLDENNNGDN